VTLLSPNDLTAEAIGYRLFGLGRDARVWSATEVIGHGSFTSDPQLSQLSWKLASSGFFTEQAGLVTAAELAAGTEDAALRFSLATAVADEARHADAFLAYAKRVAGGEPDDCAGRIEPLSALLASLPYLGKILVHTVLEGFAADEFLLLAELFHGDVLADLYRHIRTDEVRHIAIGISYLARESTHPASVEEWNVFAGEWLDAAVGMVGVGGLARGLGAYLHRDPVGIENWLVRRHVARLRAAGIRVPERR
jgi:hypothetical protein